MVSLSGKYTTVIQVNIGPTMKGTLRAVPQKRGSSSISSGWEIFQNKQLAGKIKEHLIKTFELDNKI